MSWSLSHPWPDGPRAAQSHSLGPDSVSGATPSYKGPENEWILCSKSDFPVLELELFHFALTLPRMLLMLWTQCQESSASSQPPRGHGGYPRITFLGLLPIVSRGRVQHLWPQIRNSWVRVASSCDNGPSLNRSLIWLVCALSTRMPGLAQSDGRLFYFISLLTARQKQTSPFLFLHFLFFRPLCALSFLPQPSLTSMVTIRWAACGSLTPRLLQLLPGQGQAVLFPLTDLS